MIDIRHLTFRYRDSDFCLRISALHLATGTKAALVGPSGCGKTTLTHLLAGIVVPTAGQITVNGVRVNQLSDAARRAFRIAHIGFVFQDLALLDYLTVLDNILHPYRLNKSLRLSAQARDYAISLAAMMGLEDTCGAGGRQRPGLCHPNLSTLPCPRVPHCRDDAGLSGLSPSGNRSGALPCSSGGVPLRGDSGGRVGTQTRGHAGVDA